MDRERQAQAEQLDDSVVFEHERSEDDDHDRCGGRDHPGGGGEAVVAEVLRSGYRWKGKTLRAAMVKTTD